MTDKSDIDELVKDLEEALRIDAAVPDDDDAAVPGDARDVPRPASSASSSSSSSPSSPPDGALSAAAVLSIYAPALPAGTTSLFASTGSALDSIADMIRAGAAKNIIVMAGAGISTSAGIPDFRSAGTGLYANLKKYNLPYPEAIFTIDYFRRQPKPFYVLAKELYPGQFAPTPSHFFVKLLAERGLLRRHYTQNIDCLERVAGVDPELIVEAHGSFHEAHCIRAGCREPAPRDWVKEQIFGDRIPRCTKCRALVKPDITFFGEGLPARFFDSIKDDFAACDLLVVMGTSLQVQPFASLVAEVGAAVPRLLINRERVGDSGAAGFDFDGMRGSVHRDALVLGDCDEACRLLAERLGWADDLLALQAAFAARGDAKAP
ncbi:NAD-dependent protein deacetylase sirtuin-2 [Coemansia javaensis]|uniref:NAD-dependent protein deacetylase sirtuin-2 n=1 Tax=Coemansia javaensis TaxID=2761396 RepID=A0A9W8HAW8_9FUNG|nr:NAD-dependent protein deacetylase sirtuin-2 [Coemansia javaensis]